MQLYWDKRNKLPTECTAATVESTDEDEDDNDNEGSDTDVPTHNRHDDASSVVAPSSPVPPASADSANDSDDETPDVAFAKYRAKIAAAGRKSGFSGWRTELRSWNRSMSPKHTADMDLCKYWEVRILPQ